LKNLDIFIQIALSFLRNDAALGRDLEISDTHDTIQGWFLYMFPIGYFLIAFAKVLELVLTLFMWIIVARAVLSWVNPDPFNPIVRFIHKVTEPVLQPIRRRLPVAFAGIDLSPMVIFLAIMFLNYWLVPSIERLGNGFVR
jgi:YggT family protein